MRQVKFRLVTYFDQAPNQVAPNGEDVLIERYASMGDLIELRPIDEARLDSLGALYTAEEQEAIASGTYAGSDRDILGSFLQGVRPSPLITAPDDEHGDFASMNDQQLADYIVDKQLNGPDTVALLPENATADDINKLLDAEGIASQGSPRKNVTDPLDKRLAEASQS